MAARPIQREASASQWSRATLAGLGSYGARESYQGVNNVARQVCILKTKNKGMALLSREFSLTLLLLATGGECEYKKEKKQPGMKPGAIESLHRRLGEKNSMTESLPFHGSKSS